MTRDILVANWEGGGSVPTMLCAVRRLVARGHRVRVLGDESMRASAAAVGAAFIPWRSAPNRPDMRPGSDPTRDWESGPPGEGLRRVLAAIILGPAGRYAADTLAELRRAPADLVVSSDLLFGPMIAAEATGTRLAVLSSNISIMLPLEGQPPVGPGFAPAGTAEEQALQDEARAMFAGMLETWRPELNAVRARHGLKPLASVPDQLLAAGRILLGTSRAFDFPATRLPPQLRYVGPLRDQPDWVGAWRSPWPEGDARPLVLVGFSSSFQDQGRAIQRTLDAIEGLDARALVTLGPGLGAVRLRVPANAAVVAAAPHEAVMRQVAAVVTHCGHGTVMRALAHGLPMLCLPMGRDQNDNAARVEARGAGLRLFPDADAGSIRAALAQLLEDPRFHVAAARLGGAIATAEPADALETEIESLFEDCMDAAA